MDENTQPVVKKAPKVKAKKARQPVQLESEIQSIVDAEKANADAAKKKIGQLKRLNKIVRGLKGLDVTSLEQVMKFTKSLRDAQLPQAAPAQQ